MIIKGGSRGGARALGRYLSHQGQNERVDMIEVRGTIDNTPFGALQEMDAYALGTRCEKPLYHAIINPEPPNRLTPEQRMEAVDALEHKLGLDDHARVIVMHEKEGRQHLHVVWSRIDLEQMRSVSDSHNFRKHEEVARDLERRFGHDRVQGAHAERDGAPRPDRTPSRAERAQEEKTGVTGKDVKAEITALFRASDGPAAFKSALEQHGYILAKGDRRDLVIVDAMGGVHSLARRIDGVRTAELRAWMSGLDQDTLPTVGQAQAFVRGHTAEFERSEGAGFGEDRATKEPDARLFAGKSWGPPGANRQDYGRVPAEVRDVERSALQVVDAVTGALEKLGDFIADFLTGSGESPHDSADAVARIIAQRREAAALENIRDCLDDDRPIGIDDLRCLHPEDLHSIKEKGDDYLRALVMRMESARQQERELGRERDR